MVSAALLKRELGAAAFLPYGRHANEHVVALDTGAMMLALKLDGTSFETADNTDLNDWHTKLHQSWRNIANDRLAIWTHVVRREDRTYPNGEFRSTFARDLDARYREHVTGRRLFVNEIYVTLVSYGGRDLGQRAAGFLSRLARRRGDRNGPDVDAIKFLEDAGRDLMAGLARYNPTLLGLYEHQGMMFSQPMEMLNLVLTGGPLRIPLVRGHLGNALYRDRLIFGREAIELRGAADQRYAGVLGIKEYPATTRPGAWNHLLKARFPFVISQSFTFLSKASARVVMERKQNQMTNANDRASSQIDQLDGAIDDLMSNRFVLGEHQFSMLVYGDDMKGLANNMSAARSMLADSGMAVAREDLALEAAFWSQFPGNFGMRVRPGAINSRNFAALAPFHNFPYGKPENNHWGPAVALLRTTAMSPFHFNFHVDDLGHTFICGPSGSGKTVAQNFLLAQSEKHGAQQVFFDKDRGAELFVRACGGTYLTLKNGRPTGCAPLKALEFTPENRDFFGRLVRKLVSRPNEPLSVVEERRIDDGLAALEPLPREQRSLSALRPLLGQSDETGIGARLERWCNGGALGWVLDNDRDAIALDARFLGFDMTDFLDHPEIRTPLMMVLFHRVQALADGRKLIIDIDEFWKALGDDAFLDLAQNGLKTYRKRNAIMVFGTQSPADALRSKIAHTIVEMCPTKIFMPNPAASRADYCEGFGLTAEEYRLVREELTVDMRQFLVKQGHNSVVCELNLGSLPDELAILSGRFETVDLLDAIRAEHGDDPTVWLPIFHQRRKA
ncbi:VirB4 family type IV secretion/conjugal transfer ATPase [Aureimonas sp. N4]|uniref:VirB4 family type IV secretion/conjugal transfer ATPase n=1 Tax=Aureimonas sp. N4 TaxID=1638165 RepID=UPI0007843E13|nr:VirB4 family type IV secretion/conjugal transfer ATPase [Aureimonas sp. N4]